MEGEQMASRYAIRPGSRIERLPKLFRWVALMFRELHRRSRNIRSRLRKSYLRSRRTLLSRMAHRKIFIDCGGHKANSVRRFRAEFDPSETWEIHSFEPNPAFSHFYKDIPKHTFHPVAVWIEDIETEFFLDNIDGDGSTLIADKESGELCLNSPTTVQAINFGRWLRETVSSKDYVILKLDIEGAEYDLLPFLIDSNDLELIDEVFIEWHWNRLPRVSQEMHSSLAHCLSRKLPVQSWCALDY